MILILEAMITKLTKPVAVLTSYYFFQSATDGPSIIGQAFEYGFGVGLMAVVIVMLYREWKGSQRYNELRDKKLLEIISENTEAFKDLKRSIDKMIEDQKEFKRKIDGNSRRIDENARQINNQ